MEPWSKKSVVYQIYPQSFQDTNHDGIGDLNGIRQHLDYLKELGVDVLWLNPIYVSPLVDNGYDIADYKKINPQYGTLEDFQALLKEAHQKGIRIILDMVVNHTSDQHDWFVQSAASREGKYADYYIWKDPKEDGSAPNNWGSTFGGPAWTYVESRGQYYLHCFAPQQPDLNWENKALRQDVYDQMRYWLDLGVDGFRLDVICLLSKDQSFPDNDGSYVYTKSYYAGASNGPRIHEFMQELNREVFSRYDVLTVGETPNTSSSQALLYTDPKRKELSMIFQYEHMHLDYGKYGKFSLERVPLADLKANLTKWQNDLESGWNSLYFNNHDQPRMVSRFGNDTIFRKESAKMLATLLHGMKGTPYIYQGEEIGMRNVKFDSLDDYQDIETRYFIQTLQDNHEDPDFIKQVVYNGSRDNARTPMPWRAEGPYYGFSDHQPWLGCSKDNAEINVESTLKEPDSIFRHYQSLIRLRKELPVLQEGTYQLIDADHPSVFAYTRTLGDDQLIIVCSFAEQQIPYSLPDEVREVEAHLLLSSYPDSPDSLQQLSILRPYEALIYQKNTHH